MDLKKLKPGKLYVWDGPQSRALWRVRFSEPDWIIECHGPTNLYPGDVFMVLSSLHTCHFENPAFNERHILIEILLPEGMGYLPVLVDRMFYGSGQSSLRIPGDDISPFKKPGGQKGSKKDCNG